MDKPNAGAGILAVLSAAIATHVPEVPRALPASVIATKRHDDDAALHIVHGPERPELVMPQPPPPPMPPGRGMTYAMQEDDWTQHFRAAHQSVLHSRNAALLAALSR